MKMTPRPNHALRPSLTLAVLAVTLLLALPSAGQSTTCLVANDCAFNDEYPYCRNGSCVQCDPTYREKDCECSLGKYCVSDPQSVRFPSLSPLPSSSFFPPPRSPPVFL